MSNVSRRLARDNKMVGKDPKYSQFLLPSFKEIRDGIKSRFQAPRVDGQPEDQTIEVYDESGRQVRLEPASQARCEEPAVRGDSADRS